MISGLELGTERWKQRLSLRSRNNTTKIRIRCILSASLQRCLTHTGVLMTRKETSYSNGRFWVSCILFTIIMGGILVLFIYKKRLTSNEIFSPSNKIHWEVGRGKGISAPLYLLGCMMCEQNELWVDRCFPLLLPSFIYLDDLLMTVVGYRTN